MFTILNKLKYYNQIYPLLTQAQPEQPKKEEQPDPETQRLFSNVQGNILRGFNKDHVRFIFFNIEDVQKASDWFRELVEQKKIPSTKIS